MDCGHLGLSQCRFYIVQKTPIRWSFGQLSSFFRLLVSFANVTLVHVTLYCIPITCCILDDSIFRCPVQEVGLPNRSLVRFFLVQVENAKSATEWIEITTSVIAQCKFVSRKDVEHFSVFLFANYVVLFAEVGDQPIKASERHDRFMIGIWVQYIFYHMFGEKTRDAQQNMTLMCAQWVLREERMDGNRLGTELCLLSICCLVHTKRHDKLVTLV